MDCGYNPAIVLLYSTLCALDTFTLKMAHYRNTAAGYAGLLDPRTFRRRHCSYQGRIELTVTGWVKQSIPG